MLWKLFSLYNNISNPNAVQMFFSCAQMGNYATKDSRMCDSMSQCNLPQYEEDQTFVYWGSWIPNKGFDNTVLATVNCIYMMSFWMDGWHFGKLCGRLLDVTVCFKPELPICHWVQRPAPPPPLATLASSGTCHCYPKWHNCWVDRSMRQPQNGKNFLSVKCENLYTWKLPLPQYNFQSAALIGIPKV